MGLGLGFGGGLIQTAVTFSMLLGVTVGNWGGGNGTHQWSGGNGTRQWPGGKGWGPSRISKEHVVGGDKGWNFLGADYSAWVCNEQPIFVNDTIVFKYAAPKRPGVDIQHSVHLLRDYEHYDNCNLTGSFRVANITAGEGEGFIFRVWSPWTHYFACGEHDGVHCKDGKMKFILSPLSF